MLETNIHINFGLASARNRYRRPHFVQLRHSIGPQAQVRGVWMERTSIITVLISLDTMYRNYAPNG